MQWADNTALCWSHKRRIERSFFCGQSSDCIGIARQNHQAVEHARSVQVHYSGTAIINIAAETVFSLKLITRNITLNAYKSSDETKTVNAKPKIDSNV